MDCGFEMKRQIYNLTNEPFAMFVNRVGSVLSEEGIEHSIVGGVAVQTYIVKMLAEKTGRVVSDIGYGVRVQDYLRSTDDVDITLKLGDDDFQKIKRINGFLPKFGFEDISYSEDSIVEVKPERIGASRPTFRVYVDGIGSEHDVVAMNINRGNGHSLKYMDDGYHDKIINASQTLTIPYNSRQNLCIRVPKLEHLLATKISLSRAKDLMDIRNLLDLVEETGNDLNGRELRKILLPENEKKYRQFFDSIHPD